MSAAVGSVPKSGQAPSPTSSGDSDVPLGTQASALQASATSSGGKGGSKPGPKPGTKYKTRVYKVKPGPKPRDADGKVIDKPEYAHGNYHREVLTKGTLPPKTQSPSPVVKHTPTPSKFPDAAELDHRRDTDLRRKHEVEQARLDGKKVANPDVKRPFSSVDDVIERLLPYHVLASYDADEMDLEQWQRDEAPLLCSRAQAWKELLIGRVSEFSAQMTQQVERFNRIVRRKLDGHVPGEETLLASKLLIEDERAKLAVEKKLRQEELDRRLEEKRAEEERRRKEAAEAAERVRLEQERVKREEERVKGEEERVRLEQERVRREAASRAAAASGADGSGESDEEGGESGEREGEGNSPDGEEESEDDDSDGADILINKPSHTTDRSELVNFDNPFLGSSDWTKQGPGAAGYPLKKNLDQSSKDSTRTKFG